jgi:peptidoglycan/xylan/chitin deacetylase (PgdA/CDA1 family)
MKSLFVCSVAAAVAFVACHSSRATSSGPTCSEGQALQSAKMRGGGLPPKTIALTFDDGPGVRTVELSHYLKSLNIRAGFFIMGKNVPPGADGEAILQTLVDDGHVIGNHTWTHPDLRTLTAPQIVNELTTTDAVISKFVPDGRFMFRPPYGDWNDDVLAALQASPMAKYVGPIDWDLGYQWGPGMAADWDCWSPSGDSVPPVVDVVTCGNLYLEQIRNVSSGVVLMHDPYFINNDPTQGGTVDMVKNILPVLQSEGFSFVRIDEVPDIAAQLPPLVVDAGAEASTVSASDAAASSVGTATTDQSPNAPSGGSSDPCTASPQGSASKH